MLVVLVVLVELVALLVLVVLLQMDKWLGDMESKVSRTTTLASVWPGPEMLDRIDESIGHKVEVLWHWYQGHSDPFSLIIIGGVIVVITAAASLVVLLCFHWVITLVSIICYHYFYELQFIIMRSTGRTCSATSARSRPGSAGRSSSSPSGRSCLRAAECHHGGNVYLAWGM